LHFLVTPIIICIIHEAIQLVSYTTKNECFIGLILVECSYGLTDCIWLFMCMLGVTQILLTIFGVDTLLCFILTLKPNVIMVPISYLPFLFYKTNHYMYIGFIDQHWLLWEWYNSYTIDLAWFSNKKICIYYLTVKNIKITSNLHFIIIMQFNTRVEIIVSKGLLCPTHTTCMHYLWNTIN
jgi:hypothetical protein